MIVVKQHLILAPGKVEPLTRLRCEYGALALETKKKKEKKALAFWEMDKSRGGIWDFSTDSRETLKAP